MTLKLRMRTDRERFAVVIDEVRIALIVQQINIPFLTEASDFDKLVIVDDRTAGIVRRIGNDEPCPRCDRLLEHLRGEAESLVLARMQEDRISADESGDIRE